MKTVYLQNRFSTTLNLIRFMLACIVVCFHGGLGIMPGFEAVMGFFVLSGFFISYSIFNAISKNRWSWKNYLFNRMTRLWIVLIPALLLTLFWAKMEMNFFHDYSRFKGALGLKVFLGNLFFLQGKSVPNFGCNGPLWSLSYEFWYYLLFPCIVCIFYSKQNSTKIIYLIVSILLSIFLGTTIMKYFLVWLLGAVIPISKQISNKNKLVRRCLIYVTCLTSLICINLKYLIYHNNSYTDDKISIAVGISFALMVYVLFSFTNENTPTRKIDLYAKYLAGFSYTLYLTHFPIVVFIKKFLDSKFELSSGNSLHNLTLKLMVFVVIFVYAWVISRITEARTGNIRRFIIKLTKPKAVNNYSA